MKESNFQHNHQPLLFLEFLKPYLKRLEAQEARLKEKGLEILILKLALEDLKEESNNLQSLCINRSLLSKAIENYKKAMMSMCLYVQRKNTNQ